MVCFNPTKYKLHEINDKAKDFGENDISFLHFLHYYKLKIYQILKMMCR